MDLYQEKGAPGRHYIGPLAVVQKTVALEVEDVARYKAFPFDCTHELHPTTGDVMPDTVRCVTSRALHEEERAEARDGMDIEPADHTSAQSRIVNSPKRTPIKRKAGKVKAAAADGPARVKRKRR
jgi:hypothetical protein